MLEAARTWPPLIKGIMRRAQNGTLQVNVDATELEHLRGTVHYSSRRRDSTIVASALLLGGIVWLAVAATPVWVGAGLAGLGVVWLILAWRS